MKYAMLCSQSLDSFANAISSTGAWMIKVIKESKGKHIFHSSLLKLASVISQIAFRDMKSA